MMFLQTCNPETFDLYPFSVRVFLFLLMFEHRLLRLVEIFGMQTILRNSETLKLRMYNFVQSHFVRSIIHALYSSNIPMAILRILL
jgi:hypothetical protein